MDMEAAEQLKLNIYGQPNQIISRGHGHGVSKKNERFVRRGWGFSEGLIEAWANLFSEFAVAVAARRDGTDLPTYYLGFPQISEGVDGVKFVEACVSSNNTKNWVQIL